MQDAQNATLSYFVHSLCVAVTHTLYSPRSTSVCAPPPPCVRVCARVCGLGPQVSEGETLETCRKALLNKALQYYPELKDIHTCLESSLPLLPSLPPHLF